VQGKFGSEVGGYGFLLDRKGTPYPLSRSEKPSEDEREQGGHPGIITCIEIPIVVPGSRLYSEDKFGRNLLENG
jgi:hypothetical protein